MPMILKIMGPDFLPDDDTSATYTILSDVSAVRFQKEQDGAYAYITFHGEHIEACFRVFGNAYLMNANGKTVSSFGASLPYSPPKVSAAPSDFDAEAQKEQKS